MSPPYTAVYAALTWLLRAALAFWVIFRWSSRDLLEEKTGGAKGFLDFVFHLVSLPYSLQMSIHSIHSIHSISEKRENHGKPKTES